MNGNNLLQSRSGNNEHARLDALPDICCRRKRVKGRSTAAIDGMTTLNSARLSRGLAVRRIALDY